MSLDGLCVGLTSLVELFTLSGCGVNISASDVLLWDYLESSVHKVFKRFAYWINKFQLHDFCHLSLCVSIFASIVIM